MSCPKWAAFSHAWYWSKGKEATYHNDILVASIHSCKQQPIYCIVCIRFCLIPNIWFLIRILDFGKCNPYGTAKGGERFAKDLRKGGSWELLFSTTPIYYIYNKILCVSYCMAAASYGNVYIQYLSWRLQGRFTFHLKSNGRRNQQSDREYPGCCAMIKTLGGFYTRDYSMICALCRDYDL